MRNVVVEVPTIKVPIVRSKGFEKKELSDYKLDILGLCGFGCVYCSSNRGNYLRINGRSFAKMAKEQTGEPLTPADDPALTYHWSDVLGRLREQLGRKRPGFGRDHTLVFSMLTDGFSPLLVKDGTTEQALRLVLENTEFRIRVLTKNAIVGSSKWRRFFAAHPGRFVVGLSIGTLNDDWARQIEVGTSSPTARIRALRDLQEHGVPTFGMLCPVFPDVLEGNELERLVESVRPALVETMWAEAYNNRVNWEQVQAAYPAGSAGWRWFERVYGRKDSPAWSAYATELYVRLRSHAAEHGWSSKLKYLLYEGQITREDAADYAGLSGVLLQSRPVDDGLSPNPWIAELQASGGRDAP